MSDIVFSGFNKLRKRLGNRGAKRVLETVIHRQGELAKKKLADRSNKPSKPNRPRLGLLKRSWVVRKGKLFVEVSSTLEDQVLKYVEFGTTGPITAKVLVSRKINRKAIRIPGADNIFRDFEPFLFVPLSRKAKLGKLRAGKGKKVPGLTYGVDYVLRKRVKGQRAQFIVKRTREEIRRSLIRDIQRTFNGLFS